MYDENTIFLWYKISTIWKVWIYNEGQVTYVNGKSCALFVSWGPHLKYTYDISIIENGQFFTSSSFSTYSLDFLSIMFLRTDVPYQGRQRERNSGEDLDEAD